MSRKGALTDDEEPKDITEPVTISNNSTYPDTHILQGLGWGDDYLSDATTNINVGRMDIDIASKPKEEKMDDNGVGYAMNKQLGVSKLIIPNDDYSHLYSQSVDVFDLVDIDNYDTIIESKFVGIMHFMIKDVVGSLNINWG
eukprot:419135_1